MTPNECDTVIDWCRRKIEEKRQLNRRHAYTEKQLDGYEEAMLAVMSYFHYVKEDNNNGEN